MVHTMRYEWLPNFVSDLRCQLVDYTKQKQESSDVDILPISIRRAKKQRLPRLQPQLCKCSFRHPLNQNKKKKR